MSQGIAQATAAYLLSQPSVVALLGSTLHGSVTVPWLFSPVLGATVELSSTIAVVVTDAGAWSSANQHNTMLFPRIQVKISADPTRDVNHNLIKRDCPERIGAVFTALDALLHRPYAFDAVFGTRRVFGSQRLSEPEFTTEVDGDGIVSAIVYYGLQTA